MSTFNLSPMNEIYDIYISLRQPYKRKWIWDELISEQTYFLGVSKLGHTENIIVSRIYVLITCMLLDHISMIWICIDNIQNDKGLNIYSIILVLISFITKRQFNAILQNATQYLRAYIRNATHPNAHLFSSLMWNSLWCR